MLKWAQDDAGRASGESFGRLMAIQKHQALLDNGLELRAALLDFIADFANWDNAARREYLATARALTRSAHEAMGGPPGTRPLVVDPFAGGGSIPLESLRAGADAFASDLNPIPVLLNKVVLEYVPAYGERLAGEVRSWGKWVLEQAWSSLQSCYPDDSNGSTPIAYLWARTINCEGPGCGIQLPLIRSPWIARKGKQSAAVAILPRPQAKRVDLDVVVGVRPADVSQGIVRRGSATCPCCGYTTPADRVRAQFKGRAGGASDARMIAVVLSSPTGTGKSYRNPTERDLDAFALATPLLREECKSSADGLSAVPDEALPYLRSIFNINLLDVHTWGELFSTRQALAMVTFTRLVRRAREEMTEKLDANLADAVATCLALVLGRQADKLSSLARWDISRENAQGTFGRQALPIVWDFNEVNPFSGSGGDWATALNWVGLVLEHELTAHSEAGHAQQASATEMPLPDDAAAAVITDPPYYDSVPYADLSDFFYVWMRRSIRGAHPEALANRLTEKTLEVVQLAERNPEYAYKTKERFEELMCKALAEARRVTQPHGLGVIVFAHKSTAAWEVMLQAVVNAGWTIVASWPIDTEMGSRLRAMNSATLASSVHLVCRPRETASGRNNGHDVGDWREVLSQLPQRIHAWMPRLAEEGVVGADAIFACLGPALEVFSRYTRVEKAGGEAVTLREYLEQVWAAVSREALSLIFEDADATGLEEDARLTAMWLWTLSAGVSGEVGGGADEEAEAGGEDEEEGAGKAKTAAGFTLEFDAARKIAQGLGVHLESLRHVVEIKGDQARLLSVAERTRHLFGRDEAEAAPVRRPKKPVQLTMFDELVVAEKEAGWGDVGLPPVGQTTLNRVHQAMILFAAGRAEALKGFLVGSGVGREGRFWKLAQSLSALYPAGSEEKRWIDGVLARKRALGFG